MQTRNIENAKQLMDLMNLMHEVGDIESVELPKIYNDLEELITWEWLVDSSSAANEIMCALCDVQSNDLNVNGARYYYLSDYMNKLNVLVEDKDLIEFFDSYYCEYVEDLEKLMHCKISVNI